MKPIELMRENNVSLIMLLRDDDSIKEYVVCSNYNLTAEIYKQWNNGSYYITLEAAINKYRTRAKRQPTYGRLDYLVGKLIDELIEDDCEKAYIYFKEQCDMTTEEFEYYGIESLEQEMLDRNK